MQKFIDTQNLFFCVPVYETWSNTQTNFKVFSPVWALLPYLVFLALSSSLEWSFFFSVGGQYLGKCLPISCNGFTESRGGLCVVAGLSAAYLFRYKFFTKCQNKLTSYNFSTKGFVCNIGIQKSHVQHMTEYFLVVFFQPVSCG